LSKIGEATEKPFFHTTERNILISNKSLYLFYIICSILFFYKYKNLFF